MTKTDEGLLPTVPCTGCGGPVRQRRRSQSGAHWCSKPDCIRKKTRFYRKRSANEEFQTVGDVCLAFFAAVVASQFETCVYCGQARALRGWMHPRPDWSAPCKGTGARGDGLPDGWIATLWPRS